MAENKKISELTNYSTPLDADLMPIVDTANTTTKKVTWANIKATLKTYFDTLYDWATTTNAATGKATPVDADLLSIVDSAASNVVKKLTWANLKATLKAYFDTQYPAGSGTSTGTNTGDEPPADATTAGIVELATAAETTAGTDATRAVTPDGFAGSDFGKRTVSIQVIEGDTDLVTGDGQAYFTIPNAVGGMNLVGVHARVVVAGTTGTLDVQIHNVTQAADMLSTKLTVDSGETGSETAATPPVIDGANDDVADYDLIRIDIDAVQTTPPKGLIVTLEFQLP